MGSCVIVCTELVTAGTDSTNNKDICCSLSPSIFVAFTAYFARCEPIYNIVRYANAALSVTYYISPFQ